MNWNSAAGLWDISVPVNVDATQLDLVFNDGAGTWDNNNGQDWHFDVTGAAPPSFVMDGQLDATAQEVAANAGRHLYAALDGDVLYVATEDAGEGNDVFIYLADVPGPLTAANWAKAGLVAAWDAYLADENDNDYEGWFDATGSHDAATGANGGVLEGILNLAQEFGELPDRTVPGRGRLSIGRRRLAGLVAAGARVGQRRRQHRLLGILSAATGRHAGRLRPMTGTSTTTTSSCGEAPSARKTICGPTATETTSSMRPTTRCGATTLAAGGGGASCSRASNSRQPPPVPEPGRTTDSCCWSGGYRVRPRPIVRSRRPEYILGDIEDVAGEGSLQLIDLQPDFAGCARQAARFCHFSHFSVPRWGLSTILFWSKCCCTSAVRCSWCGAHSEGAPIPDGRCLIHE